MKGAPHKVLVLDYILRSPDGEIVDRSEPGDPMSLHLGKGLVVDGFEEGVKDLGEGQSVRFTVPADQGYGVRDEGLLQSLPRSMFPEDFDGEPGTTISFETDMGEGMLTVIESDGDMVSCDFNHPLAGIDLDFEVTVLKVEEHDEADCDCDCDGDCDDDKSDKGCACGHH
jgi:FKBP-type peptidyl-prolyl cis-trans isomerase SlyD